MKLIYLSFLYSLFANAGLIQDFKSLIFDDPETFTAHEVHDSAFCSKFSMDEEQDYIVGCVDNNTKVSFDLDADLKAIERHVLKEQYLSNLKDKVLLDLHSAEQRVANLKYCLENRNEQECASTVKNTLDTLRDHLPALRITMAQMNMPGKIYSQSKPERFERTPIHPITNKKIKSLNKEEAEYLNEHTSFLEQNFREEVISENELLSECKSTNPCSKEMIINSYVVKKFEKENKRLRAHYNDIVEKQPLLAFVDFTGTESDNQIIYKLMPVITDLHNASKKALQIANDTHGDDRKELLIFKGSSEKFLTDKDSRPYCDIHQEYLDELDMDELKTDAALITASITAGGFCALTGGSLCAIGAATGMEGASYYIDAQRKLKLERAFYTGLGDAQKYQDSKDQLELAGGLAVLSVASEGVTGAQILKKSVGKMISKSSKDINGEDQAILLKAFNKNNHHDLGHADEKAFAQIAQLLLRRESEASPRMTTMQMHKQVKEYLDSLVKECKGQK
ncbi:MAG: hypothetical protein KC478_03925 [Bacteriovoracaceae bacterium]|nr:hypothetical protein [Bacteriovoracaceae bacterium]